MLGAVPMLFLMSLVVFAIVYLIPGDPVDAMLGQDAERSAREALRRELGLDQPLWRQYVGWLAKVAQGDLGRSLRAQQPVRDLILEKLPATLLITEQIFAWPGVGQLAVNAIVNRDYPVLQGVILTVAVLVTLVNLLVDALYVVLDPRIR